MHSEEWILVTKFTISLCLFALTNFILVLFCFKVDILIRFMAMSADGLQSYQASTRRESNTRRNYFPNGVI
jgi:hypothetical protein